MILESEYRLIMFPMPKTTGANVTDIHSSSLTMIPQMQTEYSSETYYVLEVGTV